MAMNGLRAALTTLLLGVFLVGTAVANDTVYYYSTDTLHSEVVITDASRNVVERTYYAPYGQVLNREKRDGPGYTGHEEDPETSLVYMQQRYYDPESGQFLSSDPVATTDNGGGFNRYVYANDNPYRYTDPKGAETGPAYYAEWKAGGGHFVPDPPGFIGGKIIAGAGLGLMAIPAVVFGGAAVASTETYGAVSSSLAKNFQARLVGLILEGVSSAINGGADRISEKVAQRAATQELAEAAQDVARDTLEEVTENGAKLTEELEKTIHRVWGAVGPATVGVYNGTANHEGSGTPVPFQDGHPNLATPLGPDAHHSGACPEKSC